MSFSYSSISVYEQCPFKYKLTRLDGLQEPSGDAAERGKTIHHVFEQSLKGLNLLTDDHTFWVEFVDKLKANGAEAEKEFGITKDWQPCNFNSPDVWLRGIFDVVYIIGPRAHVLDWKTGKERDYSDQLELYTCMLFALHPEIETVAAEICYIDHDKRQGYGITHREKFAELKQKLIDRITKIEKDTIFAPKPSYGCKWCHFRKDNGGPCQW